MIGTFQGRGLPQRDDTALVYLGNGKPRMGSTNVNCYDLFHVRSRSVAIRQLAARIIVIKMACKCARPRHHMQQADELKPRRPMGLYLRAEKRPAGSAFH